ncbi:hypothetical protein KM043_006894 [Ampulex compressa]|nr:hypothetical protein KM043_006894 [Ampulex compressa]
MPMTPRGRHDNETRGLEVLEARAAAVGRHDDDNDVAAVQPPLLSSALEPRVGGSPATFLDALASLRAKTIMQQYDSKWIVEKRFSSFPADGPSGDPP